MKNGILQKKNVSNKKFFSYKNFVPKKNSSKIENYRTGYIPPQLRIKRNISSVSMFLFEYDDIFSA